MNGYIKYFDNDGKNMSFLIRNDVNYGKNIKIFGK